MLTGLKRVRLLLLLLPLVILVIGTAGFMLLEKLSFTDALYFTIVTVSTVGYGDIHPTTTAGKIFGIVIIIFGIGTFLTIVTSFTQALVTREEEKLRRQRLNMVIGIFFTDVGNQLLKLLVDYDSRLDAYRDEFLIKDTWPEKGIISLRKRAEGIEFTIAPELLELQSLHDFLTGRGDLLSRQIENAEVSEHETFSELLWATVHLRDELLARPSLKNLPQTDREHLANDIKRVYNLLVRQWLDQLLHLKRRYPYLFSLALRTNPFNRDASPVIA